MAAAPEAKRSRRGRLRSITTKAAQQIDTPRTPSHTARGELSYSSFARYHLHLSSHRRRRRRRRRPSLSRTPSLSLLDLSPLAMTDRLPEWATVALSGGVTHSRYARHIRIEQPSHSIKGRYTIGPAAQDHRPPLYDPPLEQVVGQTSSSASFETKGSAISAEVWIMGDEKMQEGGAEEGPALHRRRNSLDEQRKGGAKAGESPSRGKNQPVSVAAKSYMGRIHLSIVSTAVRVSQPSMFCGTDTDSSSTALLSPHFQPQYTPSRPLHLRAKSHSGSLHICIPPTFSGLVSWKTESGVLKLSAGIKARYTGLGESFKHRGVGIVVAQGQALPAGHVVGKAKAVVEKKGLQPKLKIKGSSSRPGSAGSVGPTIVATAPPAPAQRGPLPSANSSTSVSRETSNDGSATLVSGRSSPNHSTAPSSPSHSHSPTRSLVALVDSPNGPELGLPAHAAATSATASGTATRGDACELITTYGNIHLYEVGEKLALGTSAAESCCVM